MLTITVAGAFEYIWTKPNPNDSYDGSKLLINELVNDMPIPRAQVPISIEYQMKRPAKASSQTNGPSK